MKNRNFTFSVLTLCCIAFVFTSCLKDTQNITKTSYTEEEWEVLSSSLDIPQGVVEYVDLELPNHFQGGGFVGNTVNNHGATLGRVLFYDKKLSSDNKIACASCHKQEKAFADPRALSEGVDDNETDRNSLALGNVRFYYDNRGFFWDERAQSVEEQVKATVTNHKEMGMSSVQAVADKIKNEEYYKILFRKAFGDESISGERIENALSQFVRSVVSYEAPMDQALAAANQWSPEGVNLPLLSAEENAGKDLYFQDCATCHGNIVFLGRATANNGLDLVYADNGMGELNSSQSYDGVFKIPFIRNVGLTGPYMHDGRFETLDEVIEHYSTGIKAHQNLDSSLPVGGFGYSAEEKAELKAFLMSMTDTEFTTKEKYMDPFK